jgi:alpha-aminoadipate/glutamate carrier protein LysW
MANCPNCEAVMDLDVEELDEGDTLTCDECGAEVSVTGLDPLELETSEDEDEEEEEDDDEDVDYDEDEEEEEEDEEEKEDENY